MRLRTLGGAACLTFAFLSFGSTLHLPGKDFGSEAYAQSVPKVVEGGGSESSMRSRMNSWTVGVAGGLMPGTYLTLAGELSKVLDDGDDLRVIPMATRGAASNLDDLLYLNGVDMAITQADVFEYFRTERKTPNLQNRVNYIIRLPASELHVLARNDIHSIEDLRGKKVNFGPAGAGSTLTGPIVFQRLGVRVQQVFSDYPTALEQLKSGEVSAVLRVNPKPVSLFANLPTDAGLHLVPLQFSKTFSDYYMIGEFSSKEYPNLVPPGQTIDTIAVPAVLAVYNWPNDTDRYRRVRRFTEALFTNWDKFLQPQRHPKWRDVNLAATVPGWTRWSVADEMLKRIRTSDAPDRQKTVREFDTFLKNAGAGTANLDQEQREELFREFMQWRQSQRGSVAR